MQQKVLNENVLFYVEKSSFQAPELNQDVMNIIASYAPYVDGLAAFRQTSMRMNQLVEGTYVGQLVPFFRRDPGHYGKKYENYFVIPISFFLLPIFILPTSIGVVGGIAGCVISAVSINEVIGFRSSCDLIGKSFRFFGNSPQKFQRLLLANTERKRINIQDQQDVIRDQLCEPISPKLI